MINKILFHSGRPLGQKGTPGTYLLVEAFSKQVEILFLSPRPNHNSVRSDFDFTVFFLDNKPLDSFKDEVIAFDPDVIWIFNHPGWWDVAEYYHTILPDVPVIYDVKTPLLKKRKEKYEVKRLGQKAQDFISAIFTLSKHSAETWFEDVRVPVYEYSLGIDFESIVEASRIIKKEEIERKRFVYIGSLDGVRNVIEMVAGFSQYLKLSGRNDILDIYGSGSQLAEIQNFIISKGIEDKVCCHGLVPAEVIFNSLSSYDAGIAWVPIESFSNSPSLKLLEYMAAKLPVIATRTNAHIKFRNDGFGFLLCDDNSESLANKLIEGVNVNSTQLIQNQKLSANYSYGCIAKSQIIPNLPKKNIKIFILINSLAGGKGGAEKIAVLLANEMSNRGYIVFILYKDGVPAYTPETSVIRLPYESLDQVREFLKKYDPDAYFCFGFNRQLINFAKQSMGLDIPFGFQECTNPTRLIENNWRIKGKLLPKHVAAWEREVLASIATRVRVVMPSYIESFPKYLQFKVNGFCNASFIEPNVTKYETEDGSNYIVSVNGMKANKNFITLLKAFSKLSSSYREWKLIDIGKSSDGNEPHKKEIKDFVIKNELEDRVSFLGPVDNPDAYFKGARFHVIASLSEGCPTVVLEAMANGIASVGFEDCPGTNELIKHNENGLLACANQRVESLRRQMEKLMIDEKLREHLSKQALNASSDFSKETVYDKWEKIFLEMIAYKNNTNAIFEQQSINDLERALHVKRMQRTVLHAF